jgi:adenylate cyclase
VINFPSETGDGLSSRGATAGRELFAIAHFDMVGYSRLIGLDDIGTVVRLRALRRDFIDPALRRHGGRLVQTAGDSLLVVFESVVSAVQCAVELQRSIPTQNENQPVERRIIFRVGIEIGDIIVDGTELHGDGLNVAARLQGACPPGGICLSRAVHDQVANRLDVAFEELGPLALKNIARPIDAFVVRLNPPVPAKQSGIADHPTGPAGTPDVTVPPRPYPRPAGGPPWIAVLPLRQLDGDTTRNHIRDGLVADIVCQLVGLRELSVISHGSTLTIRDTDPDLRGIGQRLGAQYLVRGGIRHAGTRSRLTAELTVAETGEAIWAWHIDFDDPRSFEIQDRIVAQIVNRLAPRVRDNELRRIRGKRPDLLSTYEKILLARENLALLERDHFQAAKVLLDDVIIQEPGYAEAYALASDWHLLRIGQDWSDDRIDDDAETDRLARRALALDGDNLRALIGSAHRRSYLHRDYPAALSMFQRALNTAPNSVLALQRSSYTYSFIGEPNEAIRRGERAMELSPDDNEPHMLYSALCVAHYTAANFDTAAEWGRKALGGTRMLRSTAGWAAASLAAAGRVDEAREVAANTMARWPERRVSDVVARHPYQDVSRRLRYGEHLVAAGFP